MSLVEAVIIYLSAGAPFGVLVLFSQRSTAATGVFNAMLATATWPAFGTYRLYRGLVRKRLRPTRPNSDIDPLEVLRQVSREVPSEAAELFSIAGHSNPWVATNCYAKSRKKVIDSHIFRLSRISAETGEDSISSSIEPSTSIQTSTSVCS